MENLKAIRKIVYLCAVIFAVQIGIMILMLRPDSFFVWAGFGVLAVVCLYLIRISLLLLDEMGKRDK